MKLRREIRAYIEAELRDYHSTLNAIVEDRNELLLKSPVFDSNGGKSYSVGDPTQAKVVTLMTNKRIRQMEKTCYAIKAVILALPEEKHDLIKLKYWTRPQPLTDIGIAMKLNISRRTYYNWIDGIVLAIAVEMGLAE